MVSNVPTLSRNGWISDSITKAQRLFIYFLHSEASQSNEFKGNISSLPYLIHLYGNSPTAMVTNLRSTLTRYLSKHYSSVVVDVRHNGSDDNPQYTLTVEITVVDERERSDFGYLLQMNNKQLIEYTQM